MNNKKYDIFIYGAYGFTGKLICEKFAESNDKLNIIVGGRNELETKNLAEKLNFEYVVASIDEKEKLINILKETTLLINCAGPFKYTAQFMMNACIENKCHYVDITGEKDVFNLGISLHEKAEKAGVMIMPGVGFDVVPTDCMSLFLKNKLPDATHLELAFKGLGVLSRGTALTAAEGMSEPSYIRENGKLKAIDLGSVAKKITFANKKTYDCVAIPWGDVVTAYYTTQIPNIKVFIPMPKSNIKTLKFTKYLPNLIKNIFAFFLKKYIRKNIKGPTEKMLKEGKTMVYGKAYNEEKSIVAHIDTPDGYWLTMLSTYQISKNIIDGKWKKGYQTPALIYGENFIEELSNNSFKILKN